MTERLFGVDFVAIAPTIARPREYLRRFQMGHDALHGALGDRDALGHIAQTQLWLARQTDQNVRVIGEKCPTVGIFVRRGCIVGARYFSVLFVLIVFLRVTQLPITL